MCLFGYLFCLCLYIVFLCVSVCLFAVVHDSCFVYVFGFVMYVVFVLCVVCVFHVWLVLFPCVFCLSLLFVCVCLLF